MKLSIIIPVYGVEKYIKQCAESLKPFFNDPEKEIIFVNDGTIDNSINILEGEIADFTNVKIIHRCNGGLSAARNTGLDNATGEYIYFFDSDDYIDAMKLNKLFNLGYDTKSDIIIGDFYKVYEASNSVEFAQRNSLGKNFQGEAWPFYVSNNRIISSVVWRCIYSKSIIEQYHLRFYEGAVYEDMVWTPIIFNKATNIYYNSIKFYYYRIRENSIMQSSISEDKAYDALKIGSVLIDYGNKLKRISDVNFFYRTGLYTIIRVISKVQNNDNLWHIASVIPSRMKILCSKYRIIAKLIFALPNRLVRKLF